MSFGSETVCFPGHLGSPVISMTPTLRGHQLPHWKLGTQQEDSRAQLHPPLCSSVSCNCHCWWWWRITVTKWPKNPWFLLSWPKEGPAWLTHRGQVIQYYFQSLWNLLKGIGICCLRVAFVSLSLFLGTEWRKSSENILEAQGYGTSYCYSLP